jgi:protein-S-isoprenylcysteine O-methyltransferase Ste14/membrane-associated phospholipid phosphatase
MMKNIYAKILYGLLFVAVLPFLLVVWAERTDWVISLPVPEISYPGYILVSCGILLMLAGMHNLLFFGKGLPMNAFPPEQYVKKGIYSVMKHPVYTGAVLFCFGTSVILRSSSALWLISPLFTLMVIAWVAGFENEKIKEVFGNQEHRTFFSLPFNDEASPSFGERISAFILGILPWLIAYETFIYAGNPVDAIVTNMPFELNLKVPEFSAFFYVSIYLMAPLVPFVIRTRNNLRQFITDMWFVSIIAGLSYLVFPFTVIQRDFVPQTLAGRLLMLDRSLDGVTSSLPSFHVIWAFIMAKYFTTSFKRLKALWYLMAVLISISCVSTGIHSILDIVAGFIVCLIAFNRQKIWDWIRKQTEKLANSWKEWRFGSVRLINHGIYGGAAGFAGFLIAGCFWGSGNSYAGFLVFFFIIAGAGLWAQIIEGSSKLLRPYGYYGGLTGGAIGCLIAALFFRINIYNLLASFAIAAPVIQILGRLRCLVQGCCHGKPADSVIGIRFTHPLSRVSRISGLSGVPVHPTQLYSIACNLVTWLILLRLYSLKMPAIFICGIYLILNGLGRFVEESLRGESQTPYWLGMRIYQWITIINIILGAVLTTIPDNTILSFQFTPESLIPATIMGLIVIFASGVDFPGSNRRFARLTSN